MPLAVLLGDDDHVYMMNFARCQVLVYHAKFAPRVARAGAAASRPCGISSASASELSRGRGAHSAAAADGRHAATPRPVAIDPEDIAGIYFTGGTTGKPKGVILSHRAWFHTYDMELLDFDIGWNEVFVFATR